MNNSVRSSRASSTSSLTTSNGSRIYETDSERKSSVELPEPLQIDVRESRGGGYSSAPTTTSIDDSFNISQDVQYVQFDKLYSNATERQREIFARVRGLIPAWVDGTLLRNGPGLYELHSDEFQHLFDPLAIIQRFRIENGRVSYCSKFLRSETFMKDLAAGVALCHEFGHVAKPDPSKSFISRYVEHIFKSHEGDNCSHGFWVHENRVFASDDKSNLIEIDPETLEPSGRTNLKDYIKVQHICPHVHKDYEGNSYFLMSTKRCYSIVKIPNRSVLSTRKSHRIKNETGSFAEFESDKHGYGSLREMKVVGGIPFSHSSAPALVHSFGMSMEHFVIVEHPLRVDGLKRQFRSLFCYSFEECLDWDVPKMKHTQLHVLKSDGSRVPIQYLAEPFFLFHHINTFESGDLLIVDLLAYRDASIIHSLQIPDLKQGIFPNFSNRALVWRFVLPLLIEKDASPGDNLLSDGRFRTRGRAVLQKDGSILCVPETLSEKCFEMPGINSSGYAGLKYRYCYGAEMPFDSSALMGSKIFKLDVQHRRTIEWRRDNIHQFAGEPIFVAKPHANEEDEGIVLVPVTSVRVGEPSFLVFLDAMTMQEIARAELDFILPTSFHGVFLDENWPSRKRKKMLADTV